MNNTRPQRSSVSYSPLGVEYVKGITGGYYPTQVTEEKRFLLERAMASESNYREGVTARLREIEIRWLSYHPVAGMIYYFEVVATPVENFNSSNSGSTSNENASSRRVVYTIEVFDQGWTDTLQVLAVKRSSMSVDEFMERMVHTTD